MSSAATLTSPDGFWDAGPGRTRADLTRLLQQAGHNGELQVPDPWQAADHLFGLWQGFSNFQLALGIPDDSSIEQRVDAAIEVFLRAYPPQPPRSPETGPAACSP